MKVVKYIPINLGIYHSNLSLSHAHVSYPRAWLSLWRNETTPKFNNVLGTDSISHKASYCKISQSIEVVRSGIKRLISLWNFAGFSAAVLPPRCPIPSPHPTPTPPPLTPPTEALSHWGIIMKHSAWMNFRRINISSCGIHVWYLWSKNMLKVLLTHWGRVTHICVNKLTIIGSDNGLSPGRRQAIIRTNAGILLIGYLGTTSSDILIKIHTF